MQFIPQKHAHRVRARTENFIVYFSQCFTIVTKAIARLNFRLPNAYFLAYFGYHLLLMSYKQHKFA